MRPTENSSVGLKVDLWKVGYIKLSKLNKAIGEIEHLQNAADGDGWVNRIHPLVKLLLTILYISLVVSFDKYNFQGVLSFAIYPFAIFVIGELPVKDALHRLRIVLPVVCIVGIFNPFFDQEIVMKIGELGISGGVVSMLSLMVKGILTVLAAYILVATTTIEKICYALGLLHVPKIIITQILLIYRYITLLLTEAKRVTQAYALRAPGQKGIHFSAWGSLVGQLLIRSMDRADTVYESMCLRGYQGEFTISQKEKCKGKDVLFLCIWLVIFVAFRMLPVFELVGSLFV